MSRILIALASIMVVSPPAVMGKEVLSKPEPPLDIVIVTERDMAISDAPPRVLKTLDSSEYRAIIRLAKADGHNGERVNVREYIFNDSLGYKHNLFVTHMPRDVPWTDTARSRAMQIDVFVSGKASFAYALSETSGRLIFDCRCPDSTPLALRTRYDDVIKSAVDSMIALGKKK